MRFRRSSELDIVAISFLSLFLELLSIRFLVAEMYFFGFFKNFLLMSAFLGLGLGLGLRSYKRDLFPWLWPIVAAVSLIVVFGDHLYLNQILAWSGKSASSFGELLTTRWKELLAFVVQVVGFVGLGTALFVPFGQELGKALDKVEPRRAYALNLVGSLAGIAACAALSFAGVSPKIGIVAALAAGLPWLRRRGLWLEIGAALTAGTALIFTFNARPYLWSPYHAIHHEPIHAENGDHRIVGSKVFINNIHYLDILDIGLGGTTDLAYRHPGDERVSPLAVPLAHYSLPYRFIDRPAQVAILGAGGGNDVAGALLSGAGHIDAVEIDPVIARLGRELNPLHPYDSNRVSLVLDDAREFLSNAPEGSYDVLSFGHLDSLSLVTSFSALRSDTFVYTSESLRRAWKLVRPGGVLAVSFVRWPFVTEKIHKLLTGLGREQPLVFVDDYIGTMTWILVKGTPAPNLADYPEAGRIVHGGAVHQVRLGQGVSLDKIETPTDDWPFLYLGARSISPYYVFALVLLLALSVAAVRRVFFSGKGSAFPWPFFWLGAAFMLIEAKSVTELGLLFGSTWLVNAVAISGVLVMNLISVAALLKGWRPKPALLLGGLLAAIAVNFVLPAEPLLTLPAPARLAAAIALFYCPFFFSGLLFTEWLERAGSTSRPLGANMLGAIVGGMLEYSCLAFGLKVLWLWAAAFYSAAYVTSPRSSR
jgi:hypothetical protein